MPKDTAILRVDPEGIGPAASLISIFDPGEMGRALTDNGWDTAQAIEILTEIARDAANNTARERMAAVKLIEDKAEKSLTLAGVIRRISLEALQDTGDTKKRLTADGLQLIKEGAARTLSTLELLEAGSQTPELIDVDSIEESHDPRTDANVPAPKHSGAGSEHLRPGCPSGEPNGAVNGGGRSEQRSCTDHAVHGTERTDPSHPSGPGQDNDEIPIGGAEDERGKRTTIQPGRGLPRSGSGGPGSPNQRQHQQAGDYHGPDGSRSVRRTTPYTPGEARRRCERAAHSTVESDGGEPPTPDVSTPRPGDGDADARTTSPRIAARYLPSNLAATGFPGDPTGGDAGE